MKTLKFDDTVRGNRKHNTSFPVTLDTVNTPRERPGPNRWDLVTSADFGAEYDYIIEGHGNITVLDPTSEAALQWMYRHLPEHCPRWGARGFAIESNRAHEVIEGLKRDGLVSSAEYDEAMANEERDRHAGDYL